MKRSLVALLLLAVGVSLNSCSNQVYAKKPVSYRFEHGKTALIRDGIAYAPRSAPTAVKKAIAAGNRLQGKPYKWGGGHGSHHDNGYDCSGTTSYVLREAGLLRGSLTSNGYFKYGKKGEGEWITIYIRKGHVFMTVAGLRLDTGGTSNSTGPCGNLPHANARATQCDIQEDFDPMGLTPPFRQSLTRLVQPD